MGAAARSRPLGKRARSAASLSSTRPQNAPAETGAAPIIAQIDATNRPRLITLDPLILVIAAGFVGVQGLSALRGLASVAPVGLWRGHDSTGSCPVPRPSAVPGNLWRLCLLAGCGSLSRAGFSER